MAEDEPRPEPKGTPVEPDEPTGADTPEEPSSSKAPAATPKKSERRKKPTGETPAKATAKKSPAPKAPNRPTLDPELHRLLTERREADRRRPKFVRQQAHRYYAIGRFESWRRPRGLQSKQRRHYGYRPTVVSIGFGSPRRTRGLTPSGFEPVLVRTTSEVERIDPKAQAALIARTVGTRARLVLEEVARKKGIHVLNPLLRERGGES
ncbi:MAG TPA: 50S ribosomal protein L32e [Thermoplasmata archaeon]|nr:50S ribosomal protein L32e [Thermoplasmata archaeon]